MQLRFLLLVGLLSAFSRHLASQQDTLLVEIDTAVVASGDVADIFLRATGFDSIVSLQFSLAWDPTIAEFAGFTEEDLASTAIGVSEATEGILRFSWFSPDGLPRSMPAGSQLLRIALRAVGDAGQATPIQVTDNPLEIQAFKGTPVPGGFIEVALEPTAGLFRIAAPLNISVQNVDVSCFGDSTGRILLTTDADPESFTFQWRDENGNTIDSLENLTAGDYSLVVTNGSGTIVFQTTVTIQQPDAPFQLDALDFNPADCGQDNATLLASATGGTAPYLFEIGDQSNSTGAFGGITPGTYQFSVSDANGCQIDSSLLIGQRMQPTLSLGDSVRSLCGVESLELTSTVDQEVSYLWSTGATSPNLLVDTPGTYSLTVTVTANCTATASVEVLGGNNVMGAVETPVFPLCPGDSLPITVSGAQAYEWIGDVEGLNTTIGPTVVALPDSSITYQVRLSTECASDTLEIPVEVFEILATAGPDTCIAPEATLELYARGGIFYEWADAPYPVSNPNIPDPLVTPLETTTYQVEIEDVNGCLTEDELVVTIAEDPEAVIPAINTLTPNGDGRNDVLEFPGAGKFGSNTLTIYNRWGRLVYNKVDYQSDDERFDGTYLDEPLPEGTYYYILEFASGSIQQSLLIIR